MVGLLDIAPSTRTVRVGGDLGEEVSVYGITAKGIASLLQQFPELAKALTGGKIAFSVESLMKHAPEAIAAIIAAGTGYPGDKKAMERAEQLPAATQLAFLDAITDLTMPDGVGPFMEALNAMFLRLDIGDLGKVPVSKSE